MKLGLSTYSLVRAIEAKRMTVLDVFDFVKEHSGQHVEIVPMGYSLTETPSLIREIREKSEETGIAVSNYAIPGNFLQPDDAALETEFRRLEREVDIAHELGVQRMRHDIAWRPAAETTVENFELDFDRLVRGCQHIADYAAKYGIVTSIENHGYHVQSSERVLRIVRAVNRDNFRTTIDIANFICADEDPVIAVRRNLPFASMVHLKDMYVRRGENPGEGWSTTAGGRYFRGAIFGNGDIDVRSIVQSLYEFGYNGYLSLEFEGMEEAEKGARIGLANAARLLAEFA